MWHMTAWIITEWIIVTNLYIKFCKNTKIYWKDYYIIVLLEYVRIYKYIYVTNVVIGKKK